MPKQLIKPEEVLNKIKADIIDYSKDLQLNKSSYANQLSISGIAGHGYSNLENKYKVSVVISLKNRTKFLKYSMETYFNQTMPKEDFELVFVDDGSTEDLEGFLSQYAGKFNIRYLRINCAKSSIPIWSHTPALSNNVGVKAAKGEVIVICGPEILHSETNLDKCYEAAQRNISAFGLVWHSDVNFIHTIFSQDNLGKPFKDILNIPGAKHNCITKNSFYWFLMATKKSYFMEINGVDEEYGRGVCAEDDNFAARLHMTEAKLVHDFNIVGIHMEHNKEDDKYDQKRHRSTMEWKKARAVNAKRWKEWQSNKTKEANVGKNWGDYKVVEIDKLMKDDLIIDYKNYSIIPTKQNNKHFKVLYLPLGKQAGTINAFNKYNVDLKVFEYMDFIDANERLLQEVKDFKPDLIHMQLQYTHKISSQTLSKIKTEFPKTIITNWSGDVRVPVPSYFTNIGKVVDYNLICNSGQIDYCNKQSGNQKTQYWQIGHPENLMSPKLKPNKDFVVSYVGNYYKQEFPGSVDRINFCNKFKQKYDARFALYGNGWPHNLRSHGVIAPINVGDVYCNSICVVSISNFNDIADYFSDRLLMCLASGRPTITLYFPNVEKYIKHKQNGIIVRTPEEAIREIDWLVSNPAQADEIGKNGAYTLLEEHTFVHRIQELLKITNQYNLLK